MELRGASNKQLVSHTDRTVRALTTNYLITGVLLEWRLGVVVIVVGRINEVNQHRAPLVHDG